jgi:hypothetical protein
MAKQLVRRDNIEEFICQAERKLYLDRNMILTPGAKDYLHEKGICLVYGARPAGAAKNTGPVAAATPGLKTDLIATIRKILQQDYAISDEAQAGEILQKVLAKLEAGH